MRRLLALIALAAASSHAQQPFTLQQILSAPYALSLTAAPVGDQFAWVENAEGVRNIWVGSATVPARQLTHYTQDDGQDISNLAWSPDATSIAYTYGAETGASGRPANPDEMHGQPLHVIVQPLAPDAKPQDIGEGRAPLFMHGGCGIFFLRGGKIWARGFLPQWKPSSVAQREPLQTPEPQLLCQTKEQGPFQLVTDRGTAHSLTLSPDGSLLAYISRRGSHSFLALYDLTALVLKFPAPSTGNDSAPAFSPDGTQLAWLREPYTQATEFATNRTSPNPWSIQLATLDKHAMHITTRTLFTPEANKPGSVLPRFATGDPRIWWAGIHSSGMNTLLFCSEADGWNHLYALDAGSAVAIPMLLTPGSYEVEDISTNSSGRFVSYTSNDADFNLRWHCDKVCDSYLFPSDPQDADRRHVFEIDLDEKSDRIFALGDPHAIETHRVLSANGDSALLSSSASLPMHVVFSGPAGSSPTDALQSKVSVATPLVQPQQVIFPSADKLFQLHGQLFLPPKHDPKTKHPTILFFHGGPKRQMLLGYPGMDYYSNAYAFNQYLASRGYIVLSVNYRGGIGYGLNFRQCEHCGADGAAEYADVLGAQAYLASRPDVDIKRIGLWGGSYGGYLTALALARNSDLFAAGVDFHGVHEWSLEDNAAADWLHGSLADQEKIAAIAHASSPMADIAKWRSPVLLIHGDDDPSVAYVQTPILADALRARGVHVEELIFPDEVHEFLLHKDWLAAYQAASDFFDRILHNTAAAQSVPVK